MTYLDYFMELSRIPRGSGNTKRVSDYLVSFAIDNGFEYYRDDLNNVVVIRDADDEYKDSEPVIIQGHMDMVAVCNPGCDKNMQTEGLDIETDSEYIWAKDTSLGADDGIAVAYGMALITDKSLKLPRVELIVTVDEEIGMLGADAIDLSMIKGHIMLNIDSEDEGEFITSCAGGARIDCVRKMNEISSDIANCGECMKITISDFVGGHSGTEINKGRANAIIIMGKILKKLGEAKSLLGIADFHGGIADNAICNACEAIVLCKPIEPELFDIIKFEAMEDYMSVERNAKISMVKAEGDYTYYEVGERGIESFLCAIPNGVVEMSREMEGMVETSLNSGIASMEDGRFKLSISVRSNVDAEKEKLLINLRSTATAFGYTTYTHGDYSGWQYRPDSKLRDAVSEVYTKMYNKPPKYLGLHAGLECGVLAKKIPNLDCVSFGPDIFDIHTTKEKMSLKSAERVYEFVVNLIDWLKQNEG